MGKKFAATFIAMKCIHPDGAHAQKIRSYTINASKYVMHLKVETTLFAYVHSLGVTPKYTFAHEHKGNKCVH